VTPELVFVIFAAMRRLLELKKKNRTDVLLDVGPVVW